MAKATARNLTRISLDLSEDEAQALADILAKVGGSPERSRRMHAEAVSEALKSAGISWQRHVGVGGYARGSDDLSGSGLLFSDNLCSSCDQPKGGRGGHPCDVG